MKILLFGSSGMVGQGVLRECMASDEVDEVLTVVRRPLERIPAMKLRELRHCNYFNWADTTEEFRGVDACFFCIGESSVGKSEPEYRRVTYDMTLAVAQAVAQISPQAVFVYVSGAGTDAKARSMWARVKGATENALLGMPFRGVYCFRPGYIQPMDGVRSRVRWYNAIYASLRWTYPVLRQVAPGAVTSSQAMARAMLRVAREGWPEHVLSSRAINALGA
ncbi:MAG TPA: NAD-dependent epimerase/dehydratase family protein [Acidobacteriaceae bacterium]|jgi:uncharacterized protein YbjT (DUF2867 family)|nr:NAD-dependent epimerase/dehydratase family protein [Acidobacteriaceae bacterium]